MVKVGRYLYLGVNRVSVCVCVSYYIISIRNIYIYIYLFIVVLFNPLLTEEKYKNIYGRLIRIIYFINTILAKKSFDGIFVKSNTAIVLSHTICQLLII